LLDSLLQEKPSFQGKRKRWCAVREVIAVIRQRRRDGGEGGGEGAVERLMSYPVMGCG